MEHATRVLRGCGGLSFEVAPARRPHRHRRRPQLPVCDDRSFLAAGGMGFIIGDGRLNYAPESVMEAYYAWGIIRAWTVTLDYQRVVNPAYNQDRGPVGVASLRLHWER